MPEKTGPDLWAKRYETLKVGESISTDDISHYFPEYEREIRRRLGSLA